MSRLALVCGVIALSAALVSGQQVEDAVTMSLSIDRVVEVRPPALDVDLLPQDDPVWFMAGNIPITVATNVHSWSVLLKIRSETGRLPAREGRILARFVDQDGIAVSGAPVVKGLAVLSGSGRGTHELFLELSGRWQDLPIRGESVAVTLAGQEIVGASP